jgi:acetoin utilization protein AcuB
MLVRDWMTAPVVTVGPEAPLGEALRLMRAHRVRRLPVVAPPGRLVGIVSDRDLKELSPSKATTLDAHERFYLFSETSVEQAMTAPVITVSADDTVERAAVVMMRHKISGLPVLEGPGLAGVITLDDVARVLTVITGAARGGVQVALMAPDTAAATLAVVEAVHRAGGALISLLTSQEGCPRGKRKLYVRVEGLDGRRMAALAQKLGPGHELLYQEEGAAASARPA